MNEEVRRADLYLRAEYPHFETRIFRLKTGWFQILVQNFSEDFEDLKKTFGHSIKPMTVPVTLVNELPVEFEQELEPIRDNQIASTFAGIPFNTRDLKNILIVKFPAIEICHIVGNSGDNKIKVYTEEIEDSAERLKLLEFFRQTESRVPFVLIDDPKETKTVLLAEDKRQEDIQKSYASNPNLARLEESFSNPVLHVFPTKLNQHQVEFEQKDEAFWFDHVHEIFNGEITKKQILSQANLENCCYLDYAGFSNVNIRNGLVLFDKVFVELPVDRGMTYFCQEQKVTRDELMTLCHNGKITFVLTQPYFRYDFDFLNSVYHINPNAILSRRALSALILCDLVEINNNYLLSSLDAFETLYELSTVFSEALGLDFSYVYDTFTWPRKALRTSFECMLFGSTKRIATFGINNVFKHLAEKDETKSLEFEFAMNSEKVHISSALNSFYFPVFNDEAYSNRAFTSLMGNMLNLYKNSTRESLTSYVNFHKNQDEISPFLPPVDLIEVNEFISVSEIDEISRHFFSGANFKSIISYLGKLPQEDREKKVAEYNNLIQAEIIKNKRSSTAIDFGLSAGLDTAGLFVPFLGTGLKVVDIAAKKFGLKNLKHLEKIRRTFSDLNLEKPDDKKIVTFLAKINPVARLKKKY